MDDEKKRARTESAEAGEEERIEEIENKKAPPEADKAGTEEAAATEDEWRQALETAVKQRDEYLAMAQRAQADFANFKRRNVQSRTDGYDDGVRETLTALLPVLDNLERAISASEAKKDFDSLVEGVKMTDRMLLEAAAKLGMEEVPSLGETFDPEKHNAVQRGGEGEPGTITAVYQKGYRARGRIIRYAMVRVAAD